MAVTVFSGYVRECVSVRAGVCAGVCGPRCAECESCPPLTTACVCVCVCVCVCAVGLLLHSFTWRLQGRLSLDFALQLNTENAIDKKILPLQTVFHATLYLKVSPSVLVIDRAL